MANYDQTRAAVSRLIHNSNPDHPYKNVAAQLEIGGMRELLQEIMQEKKMKDVNLIDASAFTSQKMLELRQRFKDMMRQHVKPKDLVNLLPKRPVNRTKLFERVDVGTKILEVGSGDGRRLKGVKGVDIVTVDPAVKAEELKINVTKHYQQEYQADMEPERIVTTFNAATQVDVSGRDGIGVIPDLDLMEKTGHAEKQPDGTFVTTLGTQVFIDTPISEPTVKIGGHSVGFNTYSKEEITILADKQVSSNKTFKSVGRRHLPYYFKDDYATLKLKGELVKLEVESGQGLLSFRERESAFSVRTAYQHRLALTFELFKGNLFLIAVDNIRGFTPWHSYPQLQQFLSRKKILVRLPFAQEKVVVRGPLLATNVHLAIERGFAEGIVIRQGNADYLLRKYHSFDYDWITFLAAVKELSNKGVKVVTDLQEADFQDKVVEILIKPCGETYATSVEVEAIFEAYRGPHKSVNRAIDILDIFVLPNFDDYMYYLQGK